MTNGNEPAFKQNHNITKVLVNNRLCERHEFIGGLTKREYFAALAMQGLIMNHASTRAEIRKEFWSLVAERFMLTIIDNREPQPAPICHKCKESL
jgi:ADP-heptose:LPS heptosyltransferase